MKANQRRQRSPLTLRRWRLETLDIEINMAIFTKRNHYNPCFWTACWNPRYYDFITVGAPDPGKPREQDIFALNIFADNVIPTKLDNVHYHKGLGVAEITPESMKKFYRRRLPQEYESFCKYVEDNPETLWIDFEEILTGVEEKGSYDAVIEAIRSQGVTSVQHKGFLSCLMIIHAMRSYEMMTSMIEYAAVNGMDKWEYFWLLKNAWGNPIVLAKAVTPLAQGQWIFYRTTHHKFPICDSPIMCGENSVMAILSPRLLLEINLNTKKEEDHWEFRDIVSFSKYREFRRRAINNTFKEILFHDPDELEQWRKVPEYKEKCRLFKDPTLTKQHLYEAANRIIFALSGFGRVSPEVEQQIMEHFKV